MFSKKIVSIVIVFLIFLFGNLPFFLKAQDATFIQKFRQNYQKINAWQAQFKQITYLSLVDQTITKDGQIWLGKPDKIKIFYQQRDKQYFLDGSKLSIYEPMAKQVISYRRADKVVSKDSLLFLSDFESTQKNYQWIQLSKSKNKKMAWQNQNLVGIELLPKQQMEHFQKIILGIDPENLMLKELHIYNHSQNKTHYTFSQIKQPEQYPKGFFKFKKPRGVRSVKPKI